MSKNQEHESEQTISEKPSLISIWLAVLMVAFTYTAFSAGYGQATHNTGIVLQNIVLGLILAACIGSELRNRIDMMVEHAADQAQRRMANDLLGGLQKAFDAVDEHHEKMEAAKKQRRNRQPKTPKPAETLETEKKARKIPVKVVEDER